MSTVYGRSPTLVSFDELGSIDQHVLDAAAYGKSAAVVEHKPARTVSYGDIGPQVAAYSARKMLGGLAPHMQVPKARKVDPSAVPCRYCRAEVGQPCTKWKRGRKGKVVRDRGPHPDRKYDARCATEALNALT